MPIKREPKVGETWYNDRIYPFILLSIAKDTNDDPVYLWERSDGKYLVTETVYFDPPAPKEVGRRRILAGTSSDRPTDYWTTTIDDASGSEYATPYSLVRWDDGSFTVVEEADNEQENN